MLPALVRCGDGLKAQAAFDAGGLDAICELFAKQEARIEQLVGRVAELEKRQVFDLPPIAMEVSEHRAECKWCPGCAKWITAPFPAEVSAPVQYGPGMQSVMSCLNIAQLLPCERTAEVCHDLFGHRPSAGSVVRAVARCAEQGDETGCRRCPPTGTRTHHASHSQATARKHGLNLMNSIKSAFAGQPVDFAHE